MPTSSQFLILQKKIHGLPVTGRSSQCVFKEQASCPVASVYNLSGCLPMSVNSVADHDAVKILGRESAQLFKYHSLPHGYSSILSLEKLSGVLQWQALGGCSGPHKKSPHASESMIERRSQSELGERKEDEFKVRPKTSIPRSSTKQYVDPHVFDNLIQLGFSRSALAKREDCVFDSFSTRRAMTAKLQCRRYSSERQPSDKCCDVHHSTTKSAESFEDSHGTTSSEDTDLADETSELSGENADTGDQFNRVKPSLHMRSDIPDPRPRAAIFSFRDNEYSSHAEVKYLIETQIGVKVKSIQFDPIDVRAAKPGVSSRWIVDFFSDWDLSQALKKGLIVGKDKLIFFKHDDIAKREVSSFKYFMTVHEAKKKFKNKSKSCHSAWK